MSQVAAPQITYYCVLPPQPPDVGSAIRPISRLAQEDEAIVRQRLLAPGYHAFRRFAKRSNAEGFMQQLYSLGVTTFLVSDTELQGALFMWGKSANRGGGGMAFMDFAGQPLFVPWGDIRRLVLGNVALDDGTSTTLLDIHRKSTPITPRVDGSLFSFAQFLNRADAGLADFLEDLEAMTDSKVDAQFDLIKSEMIPAAEDFARRPGRFSPAAHEMKSSYASGELLAFDIYSFLRRQHESVERA